MASKWAVWLCLSLATCQAERAPDPNQAKAAPADLGGQDPALPFALAPAPADEPVDLLAQPFAGIEELRPRERANWPVENVDFQRYAGWRIDATHGGFEHEPGLVLATERGAFVLAIADAEVVRIERDEHDTLELVLDHEQGISSHYGPLSDALVHAGLPVSRGSAVGLAAGASLRLRVQIDGLDIDPLMVLDQPLHRWPALLRTLPTPAPAPAP